MLKKRNYKNFDAASFLTHISQTNFDKVNHCNNPDTAAAIFSGIFGSILNQHAPVKVYQTRNNYVPWLSSETKELMKKRDKAKELATQTGNPRNLDQYRILRNQVKSRLPSDKHNYYSNILQDENTSISGMWSTT